MRIPCFILLMFLFGCTKDEPTRLPCRLIELPQSIRVNDLYLHPTGTISAIGGQRLTSGWYFTTTDSGQTWQSLALSNTSSLYTMDFGEDGSGWIGGDSLHLWKTTDGLQWQFHWLGSQVPIHESDRPAIRDIRIIGDSSIYFTGGDYYTKGVSYASHDQGEHWHFGQASNAQQTLFEVDQSMHSCGYGLAMRYEDETWITMPTVNDHLVCVLIAPDGSRWAASATGSVYRQSKTESEWQKQRDWSKSQVVWLSGIQRDETMIFGGMHGELLVSHNSGADWTWYTMETQIPIYSMALIGQHLWCGTADGQIMVTASPQ